jgi:hypothetical protein
MNTEDVIKLIPIGSELGIRYNSGQMLSGLNGRSREAAISIIWVTISPEWMEVSQELQGKIVYPSMYDLWRSKRQLSTRSACATSGGLHSASGGLDGNGTHRITIGSEAGEETGDDSQRKCGRIEDSHVKI